MGKNTKELEAVQKAIMAMDTPDYVETELVLARRKIEELNVKNRMLSDGVRILASENYAMRRELRGQTRILNEIGRRTSIAGLIGGGGK
jgi:hypothetical protein